MAEETRISADSPVLREAQRQLAEAQAADERAEQHAEETAAATGLPDPGLRIAGLEEENSRLTAEVNALKDKVTAALGALNAPDPEDRRFDEEDG